MQTWRRRLALAVGAVFLISACQAGASPTPAPATSAPATATPVPATSAPATPTAAPEPVTLTFVSYGGAYQDAQTEAWVKPYMEANPHVTIVQEEGTDYAKLQAMVEANDVTWDVVDVGNDFGLERNADILEPLDCSIIPCDEMLPGLANKSRIADIIYGVVFAYRTDDYPEGSEPQGWADFFDTTKFPGKRGVYNFVSGGILEGALVADGVDPKALYPLDIERALAKIDTIWDDLIWWDTGAVSAQLLADHEVVMGMSWNGRIYNIQQEGAPVKIQWNQHIQTSDFLVVPKGVKNVTEAMKLIAYMSSAEHNAGPSYYIAYAPTNKNALDKVDPAKKEDLPTTYLDVAMQFNDAWWDTNFSAANERYTEWFTGH